MKIGIVNDTLLAAEALRRAIISGSQHEINWIARSGEEAIARCAKDLPDAVLMDLLMPGMDGIEATRRIMAATPCAIVVVSSNINDQSAQVFEAMGAGALDAVTAPVVNGIGGFEGAKQLIQKL